ncbi:MAG TPA: universal stress protein [Jatrophihabitans sp.]|nr:universal stress protein [Jatrophihabitans sp.]
MAIVVGYVPTETGFLAVTEAEREAASLGVPIVIVNVIGPEGFVKPTAADERTLDAVVADLQAKGTPHRLHQVNSTDSPAEVLLATAAAENAKLIVLGLHRRSRLQKALLGSTAQTVLREATCPVLTVPNVDD